MKTQDESDELFDSLPGKKINSDRDPATTKLYLLHNTENGDVSFFDSARKVAKIIGCSGPNISRRISHAIKTGRAKTIPMFDAKLIDLSFKCGFELTVLIVPIIDVMEGYCEMFDEYEDNLRMIEEDDADENR